MTGETGSSGNTSQPSRGNNRGRGRGRGGGNRGNSRGGQRRGGGLGQGRKIAEPANANAEPAQADADKLANNPAVALTARMAEATIDGEASEADVCFICANPAAHYSIAPCNHTTCHICGLRMRALYKSNDCAHCRVCTLDSYLARFMH